MVACPQSQLLRRLRQGNRLNPGGGCSELRSCHCTPAWLTRESSRCGAAPRTTPASPAGGKAPPRSRVSVRILLADKEGGPPAVDEVLDEAMPEYRAPGRKSLLEIQRLDPEDRSLAQYKRALLGPLPPAVDPSLPNVQVTRLTLLSEQAPGPVVMDLTDLVGTTPHVGAPGAGVACGEVVTLAAISRIGDLAALKDQVFVLKEGVDYRVKITFKVHREIVSGLKCLHHTYRRGLRVDKTVYMVGSYGPSAQEYEFVTPVEEAPRGALVRGPYLVLSLFTDDDRTRHLSWEWGLHVCQDWKD
uniref:rho GDP-dissociation inhibitor 3 isoform X3 n=1 Tax=Callithrix jacchus TaxID=9483 RepID=UPI0023DD49FE|nr:rho GDP-dissociation inhibitor 3 isoform X3 [Callithrix jacchus]